MLNFKIEVEDKEMAIKALEDSVHGLSASLLETMTIRKYCTYFRIANEVYENYHQKRRFRGRIHTDPQNVPEELRDAYRYFVAYRYFRLNIFQYICRMSNITSTYMKDVNRLKLVLVEQKRTGKWLAEQLGKDPSTVSKWCSNVTQPTLDTLVNIAKVLGVSIKDLINDK